MILNFKRLLVFSLGLLLVPQYLSAQKFLIPETATVQHAGSIGFASFGVGYTFFREDKASLDLSWGYVPKAKGGRQDIFAAKFAFKPWNIKIKDVATISPLNPGMFVTHHPGGKFHTTFDKALYPDNYYWWSSAVRFHLSASSEIRFNIPERFGKTGIEQVGIYSELNTNELYFTSWFKNREFVGFRDILKLGIGVKAYF